MRGKVSLRLIAIVTAGFTAALGVTFAAAASAAPVPGQVPVPIGPNQYFSGYINGHPPGSAVINVICPGPTNTGHPVANQKIEVKPVPPSSASDVGFTGSAGKQIKALLPRAAPSSLLASFTSYFVAKNIPASITVPCSGTGSVIFAPSPASKTAVPATLTVTWVNIGA